MLENQEYLALEDSELLPNEKLCATDRGATKFGPVSREHVTKLHARGNRQPLFPTKQTDRIVELIGDRVIGSCW